MKFKINGAFYKKNVFPTYNDYINLCRYKSHGGIIANSFKKKYMNVVCSFIPKGKIEKSFYLDLIISETSKRRDLDNVESFAKKIILDALQTKGTIPNDNQQYYKGGNTEFVYGEPFIEVNLREVV